MSKSNENPEDTEKLKKDYETERQRIKELEEELRLTNEQIKKYENEVAEWHKRAISEGKVSPDEIVHTIQKEQIDALTYYLNKEHQKRIELESEIKKKEEELKKAHENILKDEDELKRTKEELADKQKELREERQKRLESEERIVPPAAIVEVDEDDLISEALREQKAEKKSEKRGDGITIDLGIPTGKTNIKDLLKLVSRMNRIKMIDAAIILDIDKTVVSKWAKFLEKKGYIKIEDPHLPDPTLKLAKRIRFKD